MSRRGDPRGSRCSPCRGSLRRNAAAAGAAELQEQVDDAGSRRDGGESGKNFECAQDPRARRHGRSPFGGLAVSGVGCTDGSLRGAPLSNVNCYNPALRNIIGNRSVTSVEPLPLQVILRRPSRAATCGLLCHTSISTSPAGSSPCWSTFPPLRPCWGRFVGLQGAVLAGVCSRRSCSLSFPPLSVWFALSLSYRFVRGLARELSDADMAGSPRHRFCQPVAHAGRPPCAVGRIRSVCVILPTPSLRVGNNRHCYSAEDSCPALVSRGRRPVSASHTRYCRWSRSLSWRGAGFVQSQDAGYAATSTGMPP